MNYYYDIFPTSLIGDFTVAVDADANVVATAFGGLDELRGRLATWARHSKTTLALGTALTPNLLPDSTRTRVARQQIEEYFAGTRRDFNLPLSPTGTSHQLRVWQALRQIPFGETRSYGDLARTLHSSPRAVGRANGANPIPLIAPCHRVLGADGSLTGFAFGTETKRKLLAHEGIKPWAAAPAQRSGSSEVRFAHT
ncbi:MAG: methylated-DNA--[protein]-cysteine S-methyltransferase [Puniceicoccales bacterium]|jgi:methylated-DNA-[protein]-cysteine S-methyltransferase|nr:methylated-DNA--[protein]-cysteine S-methyltransferase [Puniceicoccales bacterium]